MSHAGPFLPRLSEAPEGSSRPGVRRPPGTLLYPHDAVSTLTAPRDSEGSRGGLNHPQAPGFTGIALRGSPLVPVLGRDTCRAG